MDTSIYEKLEKMRETLNKERFNSFDDLLEAVRKAAKRNKVLPLYCFYDKVATLSLVDLENINMVIKFQIPVDLVGIDNVRKYLYKMAFELSGLDNIHITQEQYKALMERIKKLNVQEQDILERYKIDSLTNMTPAIYERCNMVLDKMKESSGGK